MQLVLLAAGHGRRFGGLKQLAPIGPDGQAIMDYTAQAAADCGFTGIVLVIREEIRAEIATHVRRRWSGEIAVELVAQAPVPGTAQAVLSARPAIEDTFAVANADDLYGDVALEGLLSGFRLASAVDLLRPPHVLVGYRLRRTILTSAPVTRGLCVVGRTGELRRIVEHTVQRGEDGTFSARQLGSDDEPGPLTGRERVSMNLWGFHHRVFAQLEEAVCGFDPHTAVRKELLLPDVMNTLVRSGADDVHVVGTSARCIGVTHQEDLPLVRAEVAATSSASRLSSPHP